MSGKVTSIFECPRCNKASSAQNRPERCPNCNFRFNKPNEELAETFSWGKDPARQYFEIIQQDMEKFLDKPLSEIAKALGKPIPPEKVKDLDEMTLSNEKRKEIIQKLRGKERDLFMMQTHPDDVEGWMKSIHYLMTLSIPSGNKELVSKLAFWGEEIGRFSKFLKGYLNTAGRVDPHSMEVTKNEIDKIKDLASYLEETIDEKSEEAAKRNNQRSV